MIVYTLLLNMSLKYDVMHRYKSHIDIIILCWNEIILLVLLLLLIIIIFINYSMFKLKTILS